MRVDQSGSKAELVRTPWERLRENLMVPLLVAVFAQGLLLWRNDSLQDGAIENNQVDIDEILRRTGERYTSGDARDDWAQQRNIDASQDAMLRAIEIRQNATNETLARVTALMEKYDLAIDGNADDIKDINLRLGRLEVRMEMAE